MTDRYDEVTNHLTSDEACKNRIERVWFHCFNPNGAMADWMKACDEVAAAVDAKKVPTGWNLAYGNFNDFAYKLMFKQLHRGRTARRWDIDYAIKQLREASAKARAKLAELV